MPPAALPTGAVTFLFTDIEGSTRLVGELGTERWTPLLARHRELIRAALAAHDGSEVSTEGDGFFAVFAAAGSALAAVVDAQRRLAAEPWPPDATIRVRMGLHTGEGVLDGEGLYVGPDVHRAARVAGSGHGGQVVISGTTASLVERALPGGVRLRALGQHRLKDLTPERLWDVAIEGLVDDFPPIRSLDARPNNLPTQLTSFVGRERELAEARDLLARTRLLTMTGPGGTGKTRLSLQVAADVAHEYPDGVTFVALAAISSPALVIPAIARAIGLVETPGRRSLDALTDALAGKRVLLVLDNLEQVVAVGPELTELLQAVPTLRIVATSRAALRVSGEQEYPVPGLGTPPVPGAGSGGSLERLGAGGAAMPAEVLLSYQSVRLFVDRASAVRPDFSLTDDNALAVAAICARLDGMPLAIELAAARVRVLTPAAILDRLGRALDLLAGGSRDLPERQRSLRGAIAWSHDVLEEPGRRLFERLAVFVDGVALDDAIAVCGPADELGQDVLDGLVSLADQSLLRTVPAGDEPRYQLLGPIREFALERLDASGNAARMRDRHAERFVALAEEAAPRLLGEEQVAWLDRLGRDHQNLRAALEHALATGAARTALRGVAASWRYWQIRGHLLDGTELTRRVLAMPDIEAHPAERVAALEASGGLAWWRGDYATCERSYRLALEGRRAEGDERAIAQALYNLAFPLMFGPGLWSDARVMFDEARELFARAGDADGEGRAWWGIANSSYGLVSQGGDPTTLEMARQAVLTAEAHFRRAGLRFDLGWALYTKAQIELVARQPDAAIGPVREALELFAATDDVSGLTMSLDVVAVAAWMAGDRPRSARISAAVAHLERTSGTGLNPANRALVGFVPGSLRDDPATADAWREGEAMDLDAVVAYARAAGADALATTSPRRAGDEA